MKRTYETIYHVKAVSAQGFTLTVQPLQNGVLFEKDKPIRFEITLTKDQQMCSEGEIIAYFKYNSKNVIWYQKINLINGKADIEFSSEQSGFGNLHVHLYINGVEVLEQLRGVAIAPEKIRRSYPRPADFDTFWETKKQSLKLPMQLSYTPIDHKSHPHLHSYSHKNLLEKDLSAVEIHDVQINFLEKGVSGILTRPKKRNKKSLPAILFLHGGGVRPCDPSSFVEQASKGVMIFDINAHGIPNDQNETYYQNLKDGALLDYFAIGREDRNRYYFLNMYLRVQRALDFLKSLEEWDQKVLITFGGSQGAAQAYAGAYLDDKVSAVVGQIPAYGDLSGFLLDRTVNFNDWLKMESRGKIANNGLDVAPYFDSANFLTKFNKEGFFCFGLLDQGCTPLTNFVPINDFPGDATILFQADCYHSVCEEGQNRSWDFVFKHIARMKDL